MASQAPQPAGEGKDTSNKYQRVKGNMDKITKALVATPGAKETLSAKCKQNNWFQVTADPSEKELVELVLVRIEQSTDQFDVFVSMLEEIAGMDQIVDCLNYYTGITYTFVILQYYTS